MSTNQTTMVKSISDAGKTATDSKTVAQQAALTTINAAGPDVGYKRGDATGNATYVAAVMSAASALRDARHAAHMTQLASTIVAKDLLRSQGEIPY